MKRRLQVFISSTYTDLVAERQAAMSDSFVVEFVAASGRTQALVTLGPNDIRAVADGDLVAVRPTDTKAS